MSNSGHDGHFGPVAISIFLILGGVIWVVQQAWELIESVIGFIF